MSTDDEIAPAHYQTGKSLNDMSLTASVPSLPWVKTKRVVAKVKRKPEHALSMRQDGGETS